MACLSDPVHVYFFLERDEDGYPPVSIEEVDALVMSESTVVLTGVPVFAYGVAPGDVLSVEAGADGLRVVTGVVKQGVNWVFRVTPVSSGQDLVKDLEELRREFEGLGCRACISSYSLLAVDVPSGVDARLLLRRLKEGQEAGRWYFDLGVDPLPDE